MAVSKKAKKATPMRRVLRWLRMGLDIDGTVSLALRLGGLAKVLIGMFSGAVVTLAAVLEDLPIAVVLTLGIAAAALAVWLVNGLLYLTEQRRLRTAVQGGKGTPRGAPRDRPAATPDELRESYLNGRVVRIADLVEEDGGPPIVRNRTFEDCELRGPAIVVLLGTIITHSPLCIDDATQPAGAFWDAPTLGSRLYGVVGFQDCVIRRCDLVRVGFAAPPGEPMTYLKAGFGISERESQP